MVLGGTLAEQGFMWLFWIDAVTCAAFGVLVWRAIPETRPARDPGAGRERGGFTDVLRDRVMVAYVLLTLVYTFVLMQGMTTMPLAMKENGLGPQAYGLAFAANGVLIVTVQPLVSAWLKPAGPQPGDVHRIRPGRARVRAHRAYHRAVGLHRRDRGLDARRDHRRGGDPGGRGRPGPLHLRGRYSGMYGIAWSGGFLLAPLGGTQLLRLGAPVLWLSCAALGLAAAAGQMALGPAIRRRRALAT